MNAKEARDTATSIVTGDNNSQLSEIMGKIKKSVSAGEFETWYYGSIHDVVRTRLSEMGCEVLPAQVDRNESATKIKW
jgi:hypothetical protein